MNNMDVILWEYRLNNKLFEAILNRSTAMSSVRTPQNYTEIKFSYIEESISVHRVVKVSVCHTTYVVHNKFSKQARQLARRQHYLSKRYVSLYTLTEYFEPTDSYET